jgi:hypothetical protein
MPTCDKVTKKVRGALAAAVLLAAAGGTAAYGLTTARAATGTARSQPTSAGSQKPINWGAPEFTDNFNSTTLGKVWSVYNDPQAVPPAPRRTKSSVRVRDGSLELIGHYEKPYGYVSGGVSYNVNQTYGRWVVRFRADAGAGYAPVVLLWPEGPWPADGEIDMAEISNPQRHGGGEFLHLGGLKHFTGHPIPATVDFTRWHTLAVDWLPGHITFWLDGKALWTVQSRSGPGNYVPSTPFHLALQNDEGCDVHCQPNQDTPKQVIMQVDWVKIYAAPGTTAPAAAALSDPGSRGVHGTAYSPDGKYLATADANGTTYIHRTSA